MHWNAKVTRLLLGIRRKAVHGLHVFYDYGHVKVAFSFVEHSLSVAMKPRNVLALSRPTPFANYMPIYGLETHLSLFCEGGRRQLWTLTLTEGSEKLAYGQYSSKRYRDY